MKKVLMLAAILFGTTVMVNAQTAPAKVTKEVKSEKHVKAAKTAKKTEVKTEVKAEAKTTAAPAKVAAKTTKTTAKK